MSETIRGAFQIRNKADELGIDMPLPLKIQVDSKGARSFADSSCPDSKILGIWDLRDDRIRQMRDRGQVQTVAVHTDKNQADILTKCLPERKFKNALKLMKLGG